MAASPFDGLQMPRELVCEFFAVFSRFEYTLKEAGYRRGQRGLAAPAWKRFADDVGKRIQVEPGSAVEDAIKFLNDEPPLVQLEDGSWRDEKLEGDTAASRAIDAACRVRHNLFHGGKHTPHSPAGRDEKLVRCSLALLDACLEQDHNLHAVFEGRY